MSNPDLEQDLSVTDSATTDKSPSSEVAEVDRAVAWRLRLSSDCQIAIGEREMIHLLQNPNLLPIPNAPPYCRFVAIWQGQVLPVLDVAAWLTGRPARSQVEILGVVVYSDEDEVHHGAIALDQIPSRTEVSDDQQVHELPDPRWDAVTLSCFAEGEVIYPIVALEALFSRPQGELSH